MTAGDGMRSNGLSDFFVDAFPPTPFYVSLSHIEGGVISGQGFRSIAIMALCSVA